MINLKLYLLHARNFYNVSSVANDTFFSQGVFICVHVFLQISIIASVNKVFEEWDEPNVFDWQRYANGNRTGCTM